MSIDVKNVEESFNKFVETMYQYLNEPIKDFASIKPQLLDIFKTHRPIKVGDYQYGISKSLKGKSQLIVHEFYQRSQVREYFKTGKNDWRCCECTRNSTVSNDDGIIDLLILHGIVFIKLEHNCASREISFVQKVQKLYKEKKVDEADALQKSVLGSEDLNIVSSKCRSAADAKNGTKLSSELISEMKLRLAQQRRDNTQKEEPSILDDELDENHERLSPEALFSRMIENLEEYTNETKATVMANKSKIISLLKEHRLIRTQNYLYGLTQNLRNNGRLIVFEWGDRKRVREYSKRTHDINMWTCIECDRCWRSHKNEYSFASLKMIFGIVFVPCNHNCKPKDFDVVMVYQQFLEEGNLVKARSMTQIVNFTFGESFLANVVNSIDIKCYSLTENTPLSEKRKVIDIDEDNSTALTNSKQKRTFGGENDNLDDEPPVPKKSKINKSTSIYHFEKPSISKLEEICDLLNIEYRNKAAKLWDTIIFEQIDTVTPSSSNMQTHFFETDNVYQILSIFFTGKSKQHERIKSTITDAFREKLVSSDEMSIKKFNKRYLDTVTDEHFAFIAKFLSCRILILNGENGIKKYGNWKSTTSSRLTLVIAFVDGYYSIVLNL